MLHLLIGKDWTANRAVMLKRISADVQARRGNRILLVPELNSHETERALCWAAGDTASRYAEVLSFTRMARRVADTVGSATVTCLDSGGRVAAMASAAKQLSSVLKAYGAVETKPEFLQELIDGIDEFKRCCITPQDLAAAAKQTEGALAQKLEELSMLMAGYDGLCEQGKKDPRDQITWMLERLEEGNYAQSHVFYVDGFPDFTRQNMAVLEHLIKHAPDITISLNCDEIGSGLLAFEKAGETAQALYRIAQRADIPVSVERIPSRHGPLTSVRERLYQGTLEKDCGKGTVVLKRANNAYGACMDAAMQVRRLVSKGCRYRDITLVCTDPQTYQPIADLVFGRFQIPLYRSGTEEILRKSVITTVLTGMDAALSGFEQKQVLRYLRSALSPLTPDECDRVENYAIIWGIQGSGWTEAWVLNPEGLSDQWDERILSELEELNRLRTLALTPLEKLHRGFREASKVSEQVSALAEFLTDISLESRLSLLAEEMDSSGDNRNAQILNQLWEILMSALEQLHDVLGETHWEADNFNRLLRLLLSQYKVGTIPPVLDAVQMGTAEAMRCHHCRHLLVLGADEGFLPGYSGSSGLLTDQERFKLRSIGVPLTGGAMEGIQSEFATIYGVFCGAEETITLYSATEQPSFLYQRLLVMAGSDTQIDDGAGFGTADRDEAGLYLFGKNGAQAAERLGLSREYNNAQTRCSYTMGSVSSDGIRGLYGSTLNMSASQIDKQAECRLSYFLKYGLRAKERKEASIDPAEFGSYVHAVLENTSREVQALGGFHQVSLDQTMELAHKYSREYAENRFSQITSERAAYLFKRNMRELDMVVTELWQELKEAGFEPVGYEVGFGADKELPPIEIPNDRMNAMLQGAVDRVDLWKNGGSCYYRVVDYKTGKKEFDYCDVFNGVGLQMLLYLFALREVGIELLGRSAIPAGVQYFPARAPYIPADGKMDPEEANQARKSKWKRSGLLLAEPEVLEAIEPAENANRSYTVKKDGTFSGDLADRDQMKLLRKYIFAVLKELVEDIASGDVTPNPYSRGDNHNACTFCSYSSICHADQVEGRRNYKTMTAQRFWDEIERRLEKHG